MRLEILGELSIRCIAFAAGGVCREQWRLAEVWFLPAAVPPHKQGQIDDRRAERIEMLELAIAAMRRSGYARRVETGGVNYSVDTLSD